MRHLHLGLVVMLSLAPSLIAEERDSTNKPEVPHSALYWQATAKLRQILADDKDGRDSLNSHDDVVAIHAAWRRMDEFMRRPKGNQQLPRTTEESPAYVLGFLEGRLRITCPRWWKDAVLTATPDETGRIVFDVPSDKDEKVKHNKVRWPAGTKIVEGQGDLVRISRGDQVVEIPKSILDVQSLGTWCAEFTSDKDSAYFAWVFGHYQINLTKLQGREEKWTRDIKGEWFMQSYSGPGETQRVDVVVDRGRVVVFAASSSVVYVEVFDATDGARLARFSSRAYDLEPAKGR